MRRFRSVATASALFVVLLSTNASANPPALQEPPRDDGFEPAPDPLPQDDRFEREPLPPDGGYQRGERPPDERYQRGDRPPDDRFQRDEPPLQDEPEHDERPQRHTDFPCWLASDAGCDDWYPLIELGMGWGESRSDVGWQWHYRLWAEVGALVPVSGQPRLHVGPVFNLGADFGRITQGYSANARIKLRHWIEASPVHMDLGIGPSFAFHEFDEGSVSGTRVGGVGDLSLGVLGVGSIYGAATYHADLGGDRGDETRLLAGVRGSLLMWGGIAQLIGTALGRL